MEDVMEKKSYDNIGEALKKEAVAGDKIGLIMIVIGIILILSVLFSNEQNFVWGLGLTFAGVVLYSSSLRLYAYAQAVDDIHAIRIMQEEIKEKCTVTTIKDEQCIEKSEVKKEEKKESFSKGLSAEEYKRAQQEMENDIKNWKRNISNE